MNVQSNKVLVPSAKISLIFKARGEEEMRVKPIQPERCEISLDSIITALPSQNMELSLVQGSVQAFIKITNDGEDSNLRRVYFRPHSRQSCTCSTEYNLYLPGVKERVRDKALMVQTQGKLPKIRTPPTMYSTIFRINDLNLRDFLNREAGCERYNLLH